MKKAKKIIAALLTAILALTLVMPVFASDTPTYTITINKEATGHEYEAYQVFAGDLNGKTLSNIEWGSGVVADELLAELNTMEKYENCKTAADVAEKLETPADAEAFAAIVAKHLSTTMKPGTYVDNKKNYIIAGLDAGYYFVKDVADLGEVSGSSYTKYILKVAGDVDVNPKDGDVTSKKKVKDINDTTDEGYGEWQDTADHDIGDKIPFKLSATLPENYEAYENYTLTFHDKESAGLTFNSNSVKVYIKNSDADKTYEVKEGYTIISNLDQTITDDCTFEISFADLKNVSATDGVKATNGSEIIVEYTSTLNENAVIGSKGNPNEMYLTYSNNPNGTGTGKTVKDTVIVFTYQTIVNKVDKDQKPLAGAAFQLEKKINGRDENDGWKVVGTANQPDKDTENVFSFKGLDDGTYRLTEIQTPAGYNTIDPIEFKVTATHDDDTLTLTGLNGTTDDGIITLMGKTDDGSLTTDIVNNKGSQLPETGGIGTTLFYAFGAILVVGAGILLVVRFRMKTK